MTFRPTPAELMLIRLNTSVAQAKFRQESRDERLIRVEARRFLKEPQPLTGFDMLVPAGARWRPLAPAEEPK